MFCILSCKSLIKFITLFFVVFYHGRSPPPPPPSPSFLFFFLLLNPPSSSMYPPSSSLHSSCKRAQCKCQHITRASPLELIYFLCILHFKVARTATPPTSACLNHPPLHFFFPFFSFFLRAQLQRQIKLNSSASTAHLECKTFLGSVQPSVRRVSASQDGKRRKQNCVAIVSPVIKSPQSVHLKSVTP